MIQLVIFAIASTIVARYLERSKYVIAMVAHAVLFTVAFTIALLGSDIPILQWMFTQWMGKENYALVHSVFAESSSHASTIFSAFFAVEILTILSVVAAAMVTTIRAYKKFVAKNIRLSKPISLGFVLPSTAKPAFNDAPNGCVWNYLSLGHLRN